MNPERRIFLLDHGRIDGFPRPWFWKCPCHRLSMLCWITGFVAHRINWIDYVISSIVDSAVMTSSFVGPITNQSSTIVGFADQIGMPNFSSLGWLTRWGSAWMGCRRTYPCSSTTSSLECFSCLSSKSPCKKQALSFSVRPNSMTLKGIF